MSTTISNQTAIANATASLEMEGFKVLPYYKKMCEDLLNETISKTKYIHNVIDFIEKKQNA